MGVNFDQDGQSLRQAQFFYFFVNHEFMSVDFILDYM